jgi:ribose-phosphate pyrophosphokinase
MIELITIDNETGLAGLVAQRFKKKLHEAIIKRFADGEMRISLKDPKLWADTRAVIIQSTSAPVLEHIMQVSFLAQELKNAGAEEVIAVIPYFGYARQERGDRAGKSGPVLVIVGLLEDAGVDRIVAVDLHAPIIADFFIIPAQNILLHQMIADHIKKNMKMGESVCLVSPDAGGKERVRLIAQKLGLEYLVFTKERYDIGKTRLVGAQQKCKASRAIIIDDIIDTGGTALQVVDQLVAQGVQTIDGYFVHPVLSGDARTMLEKSRFNHIFVTNTIPIKNSAQSKFQVIDISEQIVEAFKR